MAPWIAVLAMAMARKQQQQQAREQSQANIRSNYVGSTGFPSYGLQAATANNQIDNMPIDYGGILGAATSNSGSLAPRHTLDTFNAAPGSQDELDESALDKADELNRGYRRRY